MPWQAPNMWKGGECFIIGGGTSMLKQFDIPEETVKLVFEKKALPSEYSPYLSALHARHIIGVNNAFRLGNWVEVCFFGDSGFFSNNIKDLAQYPGLKVSTNAVVKNYRWVKYMKQTRGKTYGITKNRRELVWGMNSGGAAINLAVHFGAKRIILIGFDLKMGLNGASHWHSLYREKAVRSHENSFSKHQRSFPAIARDAKQLGIEILNANPDSNLTVFRRVSLQDVL